MFIFSGVRYFLCQAPNRDLALIFFSLIAYFYTHLFIQDANSNWPDGPGPAVFL